MLPELQNTSSHQQRKQLIVVYSHVHQWRQVEVLCAMKALSYAKRWAAVNGVLEVLAP